MKVKKDNNIEGVWWVNGKLATVNLARGHKVYGETIKKINGKEFRFWDAKRSKLGAAIMKGVKNLGFKRNTKILYLGAASGTTCSHVSDMIPEGRIYALDFAPRVVRELLDVARKRSNLMPMLFNANNSDDYQFLVEDVDIIFQDVAQKNQVQILKLNCDAFLKKGGYAILALKARSINVGKDPKKIFEEAEKELKKNFEIISKTRLEPFEKDHMLFVLKKV